MNEVAQSGVVGAGRSPRNPQEARGHGAMGRNPKMVVGEAEDAIGPVESQEEGLAEVRTLRVYTERVEGSWGCEQTSRERPNDRSCSKTSASRKECGQLSELTALGQQEDSPNGEKSSECNRRERRRKTFGNDRGGLRKEGCDVFMRRDHAQDRRGEAIRRKQGKTKRNKIFGVHDSRSIRRAVRKV